MFKTKFNRLIAFVLAMVMTLSVNVFAVSGEITFVLTGDKAHKEGEHIAYENWIDTKFSIDGQNVYEVLNEVLTDNGYSFDYGTGYLSSITTPDGVKLGDLTNGDRSCWLFKVNDELSNYSMDKTYPSAGDVVEVFYVDDYSAEVYGYYSTINVTPSDAEVVVTNDKGDVIEKSYGSYSFFNGKYNYVASADGYETKSEDFVVSGAGVHINVVLDKIETTTEATTEASTEQNPDVSAGNVEWGLFRKHESNNAVVFGKGISAGEAEFKWANRVKTDWSANTGSVILNGKIYTVVKSTLYVVDKESGQTLDTCSLDSEIYYTYFIGSGEGKIFVQLKDGRIQAIDAESLKTVWTSEVPKNEANAYGISPIYYKDGKVYAGTVSFNDSAKGYYYCLDAKTGDYIWTVEGQKGQYNGFYWSGCVEVEGNIVVGDDSGRLMAIDAKGNILDTYNANSGIRSTVVYDNGRVYFTDAKGSVYSVKLENGKFSDGKSAIINENAVGSTSTPAIYDGKIYVGATGAYNMEIYSSTGYFSVFDSELNLEFTEMTLGPVQTSPLVIVDGESVRAYVACNNGNGDLLVYENGKLSNLIDLGEYKQYSLHSIIVDDEGVLYHQNDSGYLIAIKGIAVEETTEVTTEETTVESTETTEATTEGTTVESTEVTEATTETTTVENTETTEATTEVTTVESTETTTTRPSGGSGGSGGGSSVSKINVSFTLKGEGMWLSESNISISNNASVLALMKNVFDANNVQCVGMDRGYISSVTYNGVTLAEFDKGPNSGWMYSVNGEIPEVAIGSYRLKDGDVVEFFYVVDYTTVGNGVVAEDVTETTTDITTNVSESVSEVSTEELNGENVSENLNGSNSESGEKHKFEDVAKNHWASEAIESLFERKVISGKSEDRFYPNDNVTRAEFVTMLFRLANVNDEYVCEFSDVEKNSWYYDAVAWAYSNGIVNGVSESEFNPNGYITKQDMSCVIERYIKKYDLEFDTKAEYNGFKDENSISGYAKESVVKLYTLGILKGNNEGKFEPKKSLTRAEAAVVLFRL